MHCSSTLLEHEFFYVNSLGVGYLQFQIIDESAKLFPRYAPAKFVLFFFFSQRFETTIICMRFSGLSWTLLEHIRAYLRFNFCSNRIEKSLVKINFSKFLNVIYWRCDFWWLEENQPGNNKDIKLNPIFVTIMWLIFACWKIKSTTTIRQTIWRNGLKIAVMVD